MAQLLLQEVAFQVAHQASEAAFVQRQEGQVVPVELPWRRQERAALMQDQGSAPDWTTSP